MKIPDCDEWGVPVEKMPGCPRCGEDELGMQYPGQVLCYWCAWRYPCIGGDPTCPCQDGDSCNYRPDEAERMRGVTRTD